jgi:hypothetical protein
MSTILSTQLVQLAQIKIAPGAFVLANFSSPQLIVGLLAGIAMAFAFQLLLTNLSVAVIASPSDPTNIDSDSEESLISSIRGIEAKIGLGALITATIALFAASYLAVKLTLVTSTLIGAIVGVTIWSIYFTILMWLGSSAVGSLIGSLAKPLGTRIVSTATSGLQGIMGTATTAIGANVAKNQAISTAEEIDEVRSAVLDSTRVPDSALQLPDLQAQAQELRGKVEAYLRDTNKEELNPDGIQRDLQVLFDDPKAGIDALKDRLSQFDRDTLVQLLSQRQDLDEAQVNQIIDKVESVRTSVLEAPRQVTE